MAAAAVVGGPRRLGVKEYSCTAQRHHEDTHHLLPLSLLGLPLLHPEVLWGGPSRPYQSALQEPDQIGQRGDRGAPQTQAWLDLEPILCFRRTHRTGCAVCGKGRSFTEKIQSVKMNYFQPMEPAFGTAYLAFFSLLLFIEKWVTNRTSCSVVLDYHVSIMQAFVVL